MARVKVLVVFLLFNHPVLGQTKEQRESLRGIKGIRVVIEHISPDAGRDGLIREQLETDVEWRLRRSGIAGIILRPEEETFSTPYLHVYVNAYKPRDSELYAYNVGVEFRQGVLLPRDLTIKTYAATWKSTEIGTVAGRKLSNGIKDSVADQIDKFINDYLTVNPK